MNKVFYGYALIKTMENITEPRISRENPKILLWDGLQSFIFLCALIFWIINLPKTSELKKFVDYSHI